MNGIILDARDSFTFNLLHAAAEVGLYATIVDNKVSLKQVQRAKPKFIILSAGPGNVHNPFDVGCTYEVIRRFQGAVPVLGICLGMQALAKFYGFGVKMAPEPVHGQIRDVYHNQKSSLLIGLPKRFSAMRYHSWIVDENLKCKDLKIGAWSAEKVPMAMQHSTFPLYGLQFHPESVGTPFGKIILSNFSKLILT